MCAIIVYKDGFDTDCVYVCLSEVDSIEIFDNSLDSLEKRYEVLNG